MGSPHGTLGLRETSGLGTTSALHGGLFRLDRHDFVLCYRSKYPCLFGSSYISQDLPCQTMLSMPVLSERTPLRSHTNLSISRILHTWGVRVHSEPSADEMTS